MKQRKFIGVAFFVFFLLANPAFFVACGEDEEFSFVEEDMLELLDEINAASWQVDDYEIEFTLSQQSEEALARQLSNPSFISAARACESRSFIKGAAACIDMTEMPLLGTVEISRLNADGTVEQLDELDVDGYMVVTGLDLTNAEINLTLPGGDARLYWNEHDSDEFALTSFVAAAVGDELIDISHQR